MRSIRVEQLEKLGRDARMRTWLAAIAALPLVALFTANARANGTQLHAARNSPGVTRFTFPTVTQFSAQSPLQDGMIAEEQLAPNAHIGLGLAPMLGRNIHSVRIEQELVPTRNPGVTFVIKFPG